MTSILLREFIDIVKEAPKPAISTKVMQTKDGFYYIDPTAKRSDIVNYFKPVSWPTIKAKYLFTTNEFEEKYRDGTGKRLRRMVKEGWFLVWNPGGKATVTRTEVRAILEEAKAHGVTKIVVYGSRMLYSGGNIEFRQFSVRDLGGVEDAPSPMS